MDPRRLCRGVVGSTPRLHSRYVLPRLVVYHAKTNTFPLTGWKKRLGYCIAFSADGASDVTRRYVRNPAKNGLPRTKASESALLHIVDEIRSMRRRDMNKTDKFRLEGEDMREDREFRQYMIENLAKEISRMLPGGSRVNPDMQKAIEQRERDAQWVRVRGQTQQDPNQPRDQRQH